MGEDDLDDLSADLPDRPDAIFNSGKELLSDQPGFRCIRPVYCGIHGYGNGHPYEKYAKTSVACQDVCSIGALVKPAMFLENKYDSGESDFKIFCDIFESSIIYLFELGRNKEAGVRVPS
jgi:hypothetical protein